MTIAPNSIITDAERVLRLLIETSDEPGAIEISAGRTRIDAHGEPTNDIEMLCWTRDMTDAQRAATPHTRKFLYVDLARPETIAAALRYARTLRDCYGNVYFGRCLYRPDDKGKYRRDERFAIPNKLVFTDDVKPEYKHDFAIYIQTSEAKGHGYKLLDRSLNAVQYADVAQRLVAHYGADLSGIDYVQLGRWPNTRNTKGNIGADGFHVRLTRWAPEHVETLEAIRIAYPQPKRQKGSTHAPRVAAPGDWRGLPDGNALIGSGRWQWMCQHRPQLRMLLLTHERVITYRKTGQADDTLSAQRAALASNLLQLHKPPPLAEIRAVALALKPHIGADLNDTQYRAAIDREIATYLHTHYTTKAKEYQPSPTTGIKASPATPRPRGRAYAPEQTRAAQLDRVRTLLLELPANDYGVITPDVAAFSTTLGKTPKMVRNYLHDLAEQKEISFAASGRGHRLALILSNRFGTPNQPTREKEIKSAPETPIAVPVLPAALPETPIAVPTPLESTGDLGVYVLPAVRAGVSDFRPSVPAVDLAALVAEAIEAYGTRYIPGQTKPVERVIAYALANGAQGIAPAVIALAYTERLQARRWARADEREAAKARKLDMAALERQSLALATQAAAVERACRTGVQLPEVLTFEHNGRTYTTPPGKAPTRRYAAWLRRRAGIYAAEEARRQPEIELTTHELWAQVDMAAYHQARKDLRLTKPIKSAVHLTIEPTRRETIAAEADYVIAARTLADRLRQRPQIAANA